MDRKFTLLKTVVAFIATFLAVSPWAAGTSNQEEDGAKVYCVKRVGYDGEYYVQLSQQDAGYEPSDGETCEAFWAGSEDQGSQGAVDALHSLLDEEDIPIRGLFLASDIDFGGYDESQQKCNQEFRPFVFEGVSGAIIIRSKDSKTYTVRGLCRISEYSSDYAAFAARRDGGEITLENVNFEDVHLENDEYAGLLINEASLGAASTFGVGSYVYTNVSVKDAVIKSYSFAGVLASQAVNVSVYNFQGENISVSSVATENPNEYDQVMIGGLFGKVDTLASMESVVVKNLSVTHHRDAKFSDGRNENGLILASIGGLVGKASGGTFANVAIEGLEVADQTEAGGSRVGGLLGFADPLPIYSVGYALQVTNTFTVGDIRCDGSTPCEIGFGIGSMALGQNPSQYEWLFNFYANYHYSDNSGDAAGFMGEISSDFLANPETAANEFNTEGTLTPGSQATAPQPMTVARGNFRNAVGDLTAGVFDTSSYVVRIEEEDGSDGSEFMNGVISSSAMKSASFAAAMDAYGRRFFTEVSNLSWQYDDRLATPYISGLPGYADQSQVIVDDVWVYFLMDCVESGCLTESEERMLSNYGNYRMSNINENLFRFETNDGRINQKWAEFAYELTQDNPDRAPVCWVMSRGKVPFAVDNVYTQSQNYTLSTDCNANAVSEAEIFLGEGVDYMMSPVTVMTFSKDSATGSLTEVSSMASDGSAPMFFEIGQVIYIYSSTPAITDGSRFKGWKLRAALALTTDQDVLLERARAGILVPSDENGYFDLGSVNDELREEFLKTPEGKKAMQEDEGEMKPVVAVLIYPEGFEKANGITDSDEPGSDEPGKEGDNPELEMLEIVKPRILSSGNAIQFVAQTGNFRYVQDYPFIAIMIENDDGELIVNDTIDNGSWWPEETRWTKYPLAFGNYLLTATIFNGDQKATYMQDFEVKSTIAEGKADSWHMVSLWNVDFDSYKWSDDGIFYWWDESNAAGKFWQYQELSRKDSLEQGRGYWYNSLDGNALKLKDSAFVDDLTWELDSVNSGWNLVSNPYGWYLDLGVDDEEEEEEGDYNQGNSCDEKWEWLESESHRDGKFDKEFYESQKGWVEEYCRSLLPAVEFWRWNPTTGNYDPAKILAPYEAVWVKVNKPDEISEWELSSDPYFADSLNMDGENVLTKSLNKKFVLAKAAGKSGWALQVKLSDARGKMDNWNVLGAGRVALRSEEPPAGMGNRVNLSIVESGKRLAKSVKLVSEGSYDWNVELSATSDRMGYLEIAGLDDLASKGLSVYVTVDGKTTKMVNGTAMKVMLSTTPKVANVHVGDAPKAVLARTLDGLKAVQSGTTLQVGFDAGSGLAGSAVSVDIVDLKGHVVRSVSTKALAGANSVAVETPKPGVYMLRVRAGNVGGMGRLMVK